MVRRGEQALKTYKEDAQRYNKLLYGIAPRKRNKRSNIFVRKPYAAVQNAVARDTAAVFSNKPYFDIESRTEAQILRADNAEKILQYFLEKAELELKCIGWFTQSWAENLGILKLGWKRTVRKMKQRMPLNEAMKVPKFKMPDELKDKHVFLASDRISVAMDEQGAMVVHEGEIDDLSIQWTEQGYTMITLDFAPPEVQQQFTAIVEAPKVIYDGFELTQIDFQDAFWDPDASSVEELRYAGHHCGKTIADLRAEQKSGIPYKNLDKAEEWAQGSGGSPSLARYTRRHDLGKSTATTYDEFSSLLRVTEIWDAQESKLLTYISTVSSDPESPSGIMIREEDWPIWHGEIPYHFLPASIIPFEITGIGIPELMEHLINERNDLRNIAMDTKVLSVMPVTLYNENVIQDNDMRNWEPGKKIPVNVPEGASLDQMIKVITPDVTALQNIEFLIRAIDQDSEETTGVTKGAMGVPIQRRTTYSEQALLVGEGNLRFRLRVLIIELVLKRLARQCLKLLNQYIDPQVEVPITGDDANRAFRTVDREDLSFEYDIYPASSSVDNIAQAQQIANNLIQGYTGIRGTALEGYLKGPAFLREYFRKLLIKNADRFIMTDQEIQEMQAQQQEAQMQAQQAQGQQGQMQGQPQAPDEAELITEEEEALKAGQPVEVSPRNNHQQHMQSHQQFGDELTQILLSEGLQGDQAAQDPRAVAYVEHMQAHEQYLEGSNEQTGVPATQG